MILLDIVLVVCQVTKSWTKRIFRVQDQEHTHDTLVLTAQHLISATGTESFKAGQTSQTNWMPQALVEWLTSGKNKL